MFRCLASLLICIAFTANNLPHVYAQEFSVNQLPVPGTIVRESVPFIPISLKGLVVDSKKPLEFQFIIDTGLGPQDTSSIKDQASQLVKYFLAGLTIPEGDLWVNLSPYEKDRISPAALGQTDLGRDLLAQDYILKQLTASLIDPERTLGKEFWSKVYAKAHEQFGTTNIPVNTFNKVWILPDQAQIYENSNAAYVTKATFKVMLDEDYLAKKKHQATEISSISSQIIRQIVIPQIEKEVNTGKNFAALRQIYQALILARWYKETIQNSLIDAVYTNKNKILGVNVDDPAVKEKIYERYLQAYKKGVFNYIKEDAAPSGETVPRKYFSGGTFLGNIKYTQDKDSADVRGDGAMISIRVILNKLFGTSEKSQPRIYSVAEVKKILQDSIKIKPSDEDIVAVVERGFVSRWYSAVRRTVNTLIQHPITVYYPGPWNDITHPLLTTDGDVFLFVNIDGSHVNSIKEKIKELGGAIIGEKTVNPTEKILDFTYRGKQKRLFYYSKTDASNPNSLPKRVKEGFDIYVEKALGGYGGGDAKKILNVALQYMRKGGLLLTDEDITTVANDPRLSIVGIEYIRSERKKGYYGLNYLTYFSDPKEEARKTISLDDALIQAASTGNRNYVKQLLATNKVNINAKNKNGETAIALARHELSIANEDDRGRYEDIIGMLKAAGATDNAMLQTLHVDKNSQDLGGIDLNEINLLHNGRRVNMQFDQAQLNELMQGGFEGFSPTISDMKRIINPIQFFAEKP